MSFQITHSMPSAVKFTALIHRFDTNGEKTGWTYIDVPPDLVQQLKPGIRREFKVKGKLDDHSITRHPLMPMGGGRFILVLNAAIRKSIRKARGAMVDVRLQVDNSAFVFNPDFLACLDDDPAAKTYFTGLTASHQRYFSKWIDDAKTEPTKVKRITMAINALSRNMGFPEMLRASKKQ